jgi:hypothetical protein
VTPFATHTVCAFHEAAIHHQAATASGTDDDSERNGGTRGSAVDDLGNRKAICIVGDADLAA